MPIRYTIGSPLNYSDVEIELFKLADEGDNIKLQTLLNKLEESDNLTERNIFELLLYLRRKKSEVSLECAKGVLDFLSKHGYGRRIKLNGLAHQNPINASRDNIAMVMGDIQKNIGDLLGKYKHNQTIT